MVVLLERHHSLNISLNLSSIRMAPWIMLPWNKAPTVGAGPFVFSEWQSGSYLRFVRNDKYWGKKASLDEIFIRIVPDDAAQIAALKTGDGDLGIFIAYPDIPPLEQAGVKIVSVNSGYSEGMLLQHGRQRSSCP